MPVSFGVTLLFAPPRNAAEFGKITGPTGRGETGEVTHPCSPAAEPSMIESLVFNVSKGLGNELVVGFHSMFGVEVPELFREGD